MQKPQSAGVGTKYFVAHLPTVSCGLLSSLTRQGHCARKLPAGYLPPWLSWWEVCTSVPQVFGTASVLLPQFFAPPHLARLPYVTFCSMCRTPFPHFASSCFGHSHSGAARNLATQVHNECDGEIVRRCLRCTSYEGSRHRSITPAVSSCAHGTVAETPMWSATTC